MRRLSPAIAAVVACGMAAQALAAAPPTAELTGFSCQTSSNPRQISIKAVMRPRPGTEHMALKFELLRRWPRQHRFRAVNSGDLGKWIHADPTLGQRPGDEWSVTKPVLDLSAPATYRFRVTFRWQYAKSYANAVLYGRKCFQR